jgi:hypothetical protein
VPGLCKANVDEGLQGLQGVHDLNFGKKSNDKNQEFFLVSLFFPACSIRRDARIFDAHPFERPGATYEHWQDAFCTSHGARAVEDFWSHHQCATTATPVFAP